MHSSALNDSVFSKIGRERVRRPPPWLISMPFHALMYSNINYLNQFHTQTLKASTHLGSKRSKGSNGSDGSDGSNGSNSSKRSNGSNGSKRSMMRVYSLGRQLAPFEPFEPFRG